jgi:RNA polymerase sigma-70 factor, ECF subfamily
MSDPAPESVSAGDADARQALFVELLNRHHRRLLGYIASLVGNRHDAEDVLQRVSLTLWRKFDTFTPGTDFLAWGTTVAFYEAKSFLRLSSRPVVRFDDALLALLARERAADLERQEPRLAALERCLGQLDEPSHKLLHAVYSGNQDIAAIAAKLNRAPQTLYNKLHLIRRALAECIERVLAADGLT